MAANTKPESRAATAAAKKRRHQLFIRSPFMRHLRRVVNLMRRLESELEELSDQDEGTLLGIWHRAGVGLFEDDLVEYDPEARELLQSVEDVEDDVGGFLWSLRLVAGLLESHVVGRSRRR